MSGYTHKMMVVNNMINPINGQSFNSGLGYHPQRMSGTGGKKKNNIVVIEDVDIDTNENNIDDWVDADEEEDVNKQKFEDNGLLLDLKNIIDNNAYIKRTKSTNKKDEHALSYLVKDKYISKETNKTVYLSQSDKIKIGNGIEKVLIDYVNQWYDDIKKKNIKDMKETDLLFADNESKIIYFAELKSNLNLDTEKCIATALKCNTLDKRIKDEYLDYTVVSMLLGLRYYTITKLQKNSIIRKKYTKQNLGDVRLVGINEFLKLLHVHSKGFESELHYKQFLDYLVKKMFKFK